MNAESQSAVSVVRIIISCPLLFLYDLNGAACDPVVSTECSVHLFRTLSCAEPLCSPSLEVPQCPPERLHSATVLQVSSCLDSDPRLDNPQKGHCLTGMTPGLSGGPFRGVAIYVWPVGGTLKRGGQIQEPAFPHWIFMFRLIGHPPVPDWTSAHSCPPYRTAWSRWSPNHLNMERE